MLPGEVLAIAYEAWIVPVSLAFDAPGFLAASQQLLLCAFFLAMAASAMLTGYYDGSDLVEMDPRLTITRYLYSRAVWYDVLPSVPWPLLLPPGSSLEAGLRLLRLTRVRRLRQLLGDFEELLQCVANPNKVYVGCRLGYAIGVIVFTCHYVASTWAYLGPTPTGQRKDAASDCQPGQLLSERVTAFTAWH